MISFSFPLHSKISPTMERVSVEEILNGSLRLLDLCSNSRDVFSQAKESLQELESGENDAYTAARKKLNKDIRKCQKKLRRKEKNVAPTSSEEVNILGKVEETSVAMFEDILSFISPPKSRKSCGKRVSCETNAEVGQVEKIHIELVVRKSSKVNDVVQLQIVWMGLIALESRIQEMEKELECVYRSLPSQCSQPLALLWMQVHLQKIL